MNAVIQNTCQEKLDYAFHGNPEDLSRVILIGHGVTGDKDRPWSIALAEALAEANQFSHFPRRHGAHRQIHQSGIRRSDP